MAKRVLVIIGISMVVWCHLFCELDNARAQDSTNSFTNFTIEVTQTITNDDIGPVWQNVFKIYGTNGLISVSAQTNTSVRTAWVPFSSLTTPDTTGGVEAVTFHPEDLVANPPFCGDPNNLDSDNDGLLDDDESDVGTDPHNPDTDGDGYTDLQEVILGSDPLKACSFPAIPPFLAAWWTFDDGTGPLATDASGNLQTGVLEGTPNPTWVTNGVANGALSFDGSNGFLVTPATAMFCNLTMQLTVSAWINPLNQLFFGGPPIVKWNGYRDTQFGDTTNADRCGFSLEYHDPTNVWFLVYSRDLFTWIGTPLVPISTNQWTHLVGTYDGSAIRIFTNGVLAASTTTNIGNITACGTDLSIGDDLVNDNRFYHGLIDDVRIYYTALGTADVYAVYKMDTDHDGLANIDEINLYHTNPNLFDSDGDGFSDGQELALGSSPTNSASVPSGVATNLLAWWKFLDGTGNFDADSSSNRMGGDLVSTPSWLGTGIFGGALQFDGSTEYVTNPPTTLNLLTNQLTVAVWINAPNQSSTSASPLLKWNECMTGGDIGGFSLEFSGSTNVLFYLYSGSGMSWVTVGPAAITANTWTHLAATYDGTEVRLYKNGVLVGSPVSDTDPINFCNTSVAIAHDLVNGGRYLTGQLADVRVYNKVLGSNDLFAIYNTDSIGDGIPDWWRALYFGNGTTTNSSSCASCDPDGDGYTNLQEYRNGLDPLVPNTEWNGPFASWTNVLAFGVTGNGVTNDTAALSRAFAAIGSNGCSPVLYIPNGTYLVTNTINLRLRTGVRIVGQDPVHTKFLASGMTSGAAVINVDQTPQSSFERLSFDGEGSDNQTFIYQSATTNILLNTGMQYLECVFTNGDYGLFVGHHSVQGDSEVSVDRCRFLNMYEVGASFTGGNTLDVWVEDSELGNCPSAVVNSPDVGGLFNAYANLFHDNGIDMQISGTEPFYGIRDNLSTNSGEFFDGTMAGGAPAGVTLQRNLVIDPTGLPCVTYGDNGQLDLFDNTFLTQSNGTVISYSSASQGNVLCLSNSYNSTVTNSLLTRSILLDEQTISRPANSGTIQLTMFATNLNHVVTNLWFGANGSNIQAAIYWTTNYVGQHPVVHIPYGTNGVGQTIIVPGGLDVQLEGDGYNTCLKQSNALVSAILQFNSPAVAHVRNLRVDGSNTSTGIVVNASGGKVWARRLSLVHDGTEVSGSINLLVNATNATVDLLEFEHAGHGIVDGLVIGSSCVVHIRGFASSDERFGYVLTNNSNFCAVDGWYEGASSNLIVASGSGTITLEGFRFAVRNSSTNFAVFTSWGGTALLQQGGTDGPAFPKSGTGALWINGIENGEAGPPWAGTIGLATFGANNNFAATGSGGSTNINDFPSLNTNLVRNTMSQVRSMRLDQNPSAGSIALESVFVNGGIVNLVLQ